MAKQRRKRGTGSDRVGFYAEIDPEVKQLFDEASATLGVAKWSLFADLVEHAAKNADWWPDEAKTPDYQQEVMDFRRAG